MNLCSDGHEEVCYEGRKCPCCEVKEELARADENADEKIGSLKEELATLKQEKETI